MWYHVAGVYNASAQTLDIYVNGVQDNGTLRGTIPASQINSAVNVNIGRRSGGYYFNGVIDDVRIYNRALSQAEIQADMNTPVGTPTPTPTPTATSTSTPTPTLRLHLPYVYTYPYRHNYRHTCTDRNTYCDSNRDSHGNIYCNRIPTPTPIETATPHPVGPFAAMAVSCTETDLSWGYCCLNLANGGFDIERGTDNMHFTQINRVGFWERSYQDVTAPSGLNYYRIRAFNDYGVGDYRFASATQPGCQSLTPTGTPTPTPTVTPTPAAVR